MNVMLAIIHVLIVVKENRSTKLPIIKFHLGGGKP